ncbi:MAG: NifU N-terminal domain-containing protein [Phycisphaeraceae bacterium]|nr:NifU N-terminal domain-containing protein [Phycisphaeraceae bacterium]
MGYRVREFQETPNPSAVKIVVDAPISPLEGRSETPRSYRSAESAAQDPLAARLFRVSGVENVLIATDWLTVGKRADATWKSVKGAVEKALAEAE